MTACDEVLSFRGTVVCLLTSLTPETVAQMCEMLWNYSWVWLPVKLNLRCQLHVSVLPLLHLAGWREWQAGCWLFSSVKQNHWRTRRVYNTGSFLFYCHRIQSRWDDDSLGILTSRCCSQVSSVCSSTQWIASVIFPASRSWRCISPSCVIVRRII